MKKLRMRIYSRQIKLSKYLDEPARRGVYAGLLVYKHTYKKKVNLSFKAIDRGMRSNPFVAFRVFPRSAPDGIRFLSISQVTCIFAFAPLLLHYSGNVLRWKRVLADKGCTEGQWKYSKFYVSLCVWTFYRTKKKLKLKSKRLSTEKCYFLRKT